MIPPFQKASKVSILPSAWGIPIGNRSARSEYNKSKLETRQADINVKKKELDIVVEVRVAVRQVMTNIERVAATKKARELTQKGSIWKKKSTASAGLQAWKSCAQGKPCHC